MARIRTIKPEFWRHEELSALPEATHLLAAALLNYADDHGYFNANPALVKAECSPLREPSVSIPESFRSLQTIGYIQLGTCVNGRRFGRIVAFAAHQRVSHPTDSKIAVMPITWDCSGNIPEDSVRAPEVFVPEQGTGNREKEQGTGNREVPPTASAVSDSPATISRLPVKRKNRETPEDGFDDFWSAYPRKQARANAIGPWNRLAETDRAAAIDDVRRRSCLDPQWLNEGGKFVPHAATYLNQKRWLDQWTPTGQFSRTTNTNIENARRFLEGMA